MIVPFDLEYGQAAGYGQIGLKSLTCFKGCHRCKPIPRTGRAGRPGLALGRLYGPGSGQSSWAQGPLYPWKRFPKPVTSDGCEERTMAAIAL